MQVEVGFQQAQRREFGFGSRLFRSVREGWRPETDTAHGLSTEWAKCSTRDRKVDTLPPRFMEFHPARFPSVPSHRFLLLTKPTRRENFPSHSSLWHFGCTRIALLAETSSR